MIDISITKLLTLVTGLLVASVSALEINAQAGTAYTLNAQLKAAIEEFTKVGDRHNIEQPGKIIYSKFGVVANHSLMGSVIF